MSSPGVGLDRLRKGKVTDPLKKTGTCSGSLRSRCPVLRTASSGLRAYGEIASMEFWRKYDTRFGDAAMRVNDVYLKAQGQEQGIDSYGSMVDLLVADYRRESR